MSEKLNSFYSQLAEIHKEHFSAWRAGQLFFNFTEWLLLVKNKSYFVLAEEDLLTYLQEYADSWKGKWRK